MYELIDRVLVYTDVPVLEEQYESMLYGNIGRRWPYNTTPMLTAFLDRQQSWARKFEDYLDTRRLA